MIWSDCNTEGAARNSVTKQTAGNWRSRSLERGLINAAFDDVDCVYHLAKGVQPDEHDIGKRVLAAAKRLSVRCSVITA